MATTPYCSGCYETATVTIEMRERRKLASRRGDLDTKFLRGAWNPFLARKHCDQLDSRAWLRHRIGRLEQMVARGLEWPWWLRSLW